jgi:hypothetical protein
MTDFDDIIRQAREGLEPSAADRERVWNGLSLRAGVLGAALLVTKASAGAAGTGGALAGQSVGALAKLFFGSMAVTLVAGGAAVGITRYRPATPERPLPTPSVAGGVATTRAGETQAFQAASEETSPPPAEGTKTPSRSAPPEPGPGSAASAPIDGALADRQEIARELALLQEVRRAASSAEYERAKRLLDRLDGEFPRGALLEERAALRVVTACEAGDASGGELAADFLRRYASSVYAAKVERVCRVKR